MDVDLLRRMVGRELLSRAQNEEALAVEIVAQDPRKFVDIISKMQKMRGEREMQAIIETLSRDEKLGFTFVAINPKASIDKVMDYLEKQL